MRTYYRFEHGNLNTRNWHSPPYGWQLTIKKALSEYIKDQKHDIAIAKSNILSAKKESKL